MSDFSVLAILLRKIQLKVAKTQFLLLYFFILATVYNANTLMKVKTLKGIFQVLSSFFPFSHLTISWKNNLCFLSCPYSTQAFLLYICIQQLPCFSQKFVVSALLLCKGRETIHIQQFSLKEVVITLKLQEWIGSGVDLQSICNLNIFFIW